MKANYVCVGVPRVVQTKTGVRVHIGMTTVAKRKALLVCLILALLLVNSVHAYGVFTEWFDARWKPVHTGKRTVSVAAPKDSALFKQTVAWVQKNAKKPVSEDFAKLVVEETFNNAAKADVDPFVMLAIMKVESEFDYTARSKAGAIGLTQVIPKWHMDKMPNTAHVYDPKNNIRVGTEVMAEYLSWYNGDMRKALLQYNGSLHLPGSDYSNKVMTSRTSLMTWLDKNRG